MEWLIDRIRNSTSSRGKTIVFPEATDTRITKAASWLIEHQVCSVLLVGEKNAILEKADREGIDLPDSILYRPPGAIDDQLLTNLLTRRKHKNMGREEAVGLLKQPLQMAAGLVATGQADGCVAGVAHSSADVIRAAIYNIGLKSDATIISSTFLMRLQDRRTVTFADCGVIPYPNAAELAEIALESARTHQLLTNEEPMVAMLSYSTKGSARHERITLITEALKIAQKKNPGLLIDGEFQFDTAFVPEVAHQKAPESKVAGQANTFIFPNLDAGNIAYKIAERLAGAEATGPILQGIAKPMIDLSRGCNWQTIVRAACVTLLMNIEYN